MCNAKKKYFNGYGHISMLSCIVPALLLSYEGYEDLKEQTFSNSHFLLFESTATDHIGGHSLGFILLLLLLFIFPFMKQHGK